MDLCCFRKNSGAGTAPAASGDVNCTYGQEGI